MPRILVMRISSFGDVAMLVPVIFSVAARYPQERFIILTRKAFAPLFENLNFNVGVRIFDNNRHGSAWGLMKLVVSLSRSNYSHVADLHDVLRTKVIRKVLRLEGKKTAYIQKGRADKKNMIHSKEVGIPLESTTSRYLKVFEKIGFPAKMSFTNFYELKERSLYPLRSIVKEKVGKWIGIAPFSKHKQKMYPIEKMENVIYALAENKDNTIFLFGTNDAERSLIERWTKKHSNIIDLARKLNLETELLLISYLDVMLSMDSANMHLASLVETPVVSIWGPTHPSLGFYGYKQDLNNALQGEIECRPCSVFGDLPCSRGDIACMQMIKETTVLDKIEEVLAKTTK